MFNVESQGAVDVVKPLAPINHENAAELEETFLNRLSEGQPMVVFDMTEVPLIDSAALNALLNVQEELHSRGGSIKLAAVPQLCQEILRITGVAERFECHVDVKTAVGSFIQ